MSHGRDVLEGAADVLFVATREWLHAKAAVEREEQTLTAARAARRNRYRLAQTQLERLAAIDTQIDLLRATPGLPDSEGLLSELLAVRAKLVAQRRRERSQR